MITIIGSESPGRAVLSGLLAAGLPRTQVVVAVPDKNETIPDREQAEGLADGLGLRTVPVWNAADADLVLLAVPPTQVDAVVQHIKPKIEAGAVVASCVPGVPISQIEENLSGESTVVQVTPDAAVMAGQRGRCVLTMGATPATTGGDGVARVRQLLGTMADVVGTATAARGPEAPM